VLTCEHVCLRVLGPEFRVQKVHYRRKIICTFHRAKFTLVMIFMMIFIILNHYVKELQKTAILGTAHRLREVLM
jgi:hypothetical protein